MTALHYLRFIRFIAQINLDSKKKIFFIIRLDIITAPTRHSTINEWNQPSVNLIYLFPVL